MTTSLHIIGITNEQTECDRCGRLELSNTVIVGGEEGELGRYGTACESKILGIKITAQDARNAEARRRFLVRDELRRAVRAQEAGDIDSVIMYLEGARGYGIVRADEIALVEKLESIV